MRYDYVCQECGDVFEVSRRHDDASPVACPTDGSTETKKVILSTPLIHVSWRNTMGLGHSGQIVMGAVHNRPAKRDIQKRKKVRIKDEDTIQV